MPRMRSVYSAKSPLQPGPLAAAGPVPILIARISGRCYLHRHAVLRNAGLPANTVLLYRSYSVKRPYAEDYLPDHLLRSDAPDTGISRVHRDSSVVSQNEYPFIRYLIWKIYIRLPKRLLIQIRLVYLIMVDGYISLQIDVHPLT